jgi:hypothetical protein
MNHRARRILLLAITISVSLLILTTCSPSTITPIPTIPECGKSEGEAADDIIYTPFGPGYRGNFHQEGVTNPWPTIVSVPVFLSAGDDEPLIGLMYRNYIETRAGETRNNILYLSTSEEGASINSIELYTSDTPSKIKIAECMRYMGPQSRHIRVLSIEIGEDIALGEYTFKIGFIINGTDYGVVFCTIKVAAIRFELMTKGL